MLRAFVLALLIANITFFAWTQGWLGAAHSQTADREPDRLQRQVNAEHVKVNAAASRQAASASSAPVAPAPSKSSPAPQALACLEAGPLADDEAMQLARATIKHIGLSTANLSVRQEETPPTWAVITIKMPSRDFQTRKEETLKRLHIPYTILHSPPELDTSLLLSQHENQAQAQAQFDAHERRGLKGIRVLAMPRPNAQYLHINQLSASQHAELLKLRDKALGPRRFMACAATSGNTGTSP